jgi:hypothetical protein
MKQSSTMTTSIRYAFEICIESLDAFHALNAYQSRQLTPNEKQALQRMKTRLAMTKKWIDKGRPVDEENINIILFGSKSVNPRVLPSVLSFLERILDESMITKKDTNTFSVPWRRAVKYFETVSAVWSEFLFFEVKKLQSVSSLPFLDYLDYTVELPRK